MVLWGSVSMTMWSWLLVGFYLLVNGYTMFALYSMGKGTFENGQLVNVGMSLETPGTYSPLSLISRTLYLSLYWIYHLSLFLSHPFSCPSRCGLSFRNHELIQFLLPFFQTQTKNSPSQVTSNITGMSCTSLGSCNFSLSTHLGRSSSTLW